MIITITDYSDNNYNFECDPDDNQNNYSVFGFVFIIAASVMNIIIVII